jgi:hypothetical protein
MYTLAEIQSEFERGSLPQALLKLRLFSLEKKMKFPFKWASLELYGYTEFLQETDESLPWWRDCLVVWIDLRNKVIGTEYQDGRDQAWVYNGIKDIEEQSKEGLPPGEFRIPPPEGKEDSVQFGMVEINPLYDRIREAGLHILLDIERLLREEADQNSQNETFSLGQAMEEILGFRNYIERQAHRDVFVNGSPQESIARSLLQAYLQSRSYREVGVRGGQSDILSFSKGGRFLYETKIWRGQEYHDQGLRELEEYILGEGDDPDLMGVFYIIFDPTKNQSAQGFLGDTSTTVTVANRDVQIVVINLVPPTPSKKK